jgi:SAM-dependent methyltransferase
MIRRRMAPQDGSIVVAPTQDGTPVADGRGPRPATACRVCGASLELLHRGTAAPPTPDAFSPSRHRPGEHGDLYACRECGTVQQPSLPDRARLHALYQAMADPGYLDEEAGRRRTARRLLDLIAPHAPEGRLLDVGCGHGLLLAEARQRGYDVLGLELSAVAARHARDTFGVPVLETALEDFVAVPEERFDVIVLADVIEHLDDPVAALDACAELLADGGVLCVVTPDPSSAAARLAGSRWWGYLPAHSFLFPRRTLRELLAARGLVVSTDVPLVRSFRLERWVAGLAERAGPLSGPLARLGRTRLGSREVSLSLGDERVVLAHRLAPVRAERPAVIDRGGERKVHVVIPAYNASSTLPRVVEHLDPAVADRALLVDDASPDATTQVALDHGLEVLRHPTNRGYGANQKTLYVNALRAGADVVVMVHGDNQYDPALVEEMVRPILEDRADVVIGSRLLEDRAIVGGMPRWKWLGNRGLTRVENWAFRKRFSEYHTGYRAFSAETLRGIAFLRNSDGFVFDQEIFAQLIARGARIAEIPIPTRYFVEASSVSFPTSVVYGLRTLLVLLRFRAHPRRGWSALGRPASVIRATQATERATAARQSASA